MNANQIPEKLEFGGIAQSIDADTTDAAELLIVYRRLAPFGKMIVRETALMIERGATKAEYGAFVTSLIDAEEFPVYRLLLVNTRENWTGEDLDGDRQTTARAVTYLARMIDQKDGESL